MGDFLRAKPESEYVLSTKVGRLLRPVPTGTVPDYSYVDPLSSDADYDYSYDGIMRSVDFSYARLGLNRVDILYVHDIGSYTHGAEKNAVHLKNFLNSGIKALEELKSSGAIKAFGLGVNEVPRRLTFDAQRRHRRHPDGRALYLAGSLRRGGSPAALPQESARLWLSAASSIPASLRPVRCRAGIPTTCPRHRTCLPRWARWKTLPNATALCSRPRRCNSRSASQPFLPC